MKRKFQKSGLILAAALALTNCTKEMEMPSQEPETLQPGTPFEITTDVNTKTSNNGMSTIWTDTDKLTLFYAPAGEKEVFSDNRIFSRNPQRPNGFYGSLDEANHPLSANNDWYAFYPDNSYMDTPLGKKGYFTIGSYTEKDQKQDGPMSTAGLAGENCPLWGRQLSVPENDTPAIRMHQLYTVIRVKVSNRTSKPVEIKNIVFNAPGKKLIGNFFADLTAEQGARLIPRSGHTSDEARLSVTSSRLGRGEYGEFYIVCAPFTLEKDDFIRVKVNNCIKEKIITRTNDFKAGEITDINFGYTAVDGENVIPWVEDFSAKEVMTNYPGSSAGVELMSGDNYAHGEAPEIMIRKKASDGTLNEFVASIMLNGVSAGEQLSLSFKSNKPEKLELSSSTPGVSFQKVSDISYLVTVGSIPADRKMELVFANPSTDNVRLDDIQLTKRIYPAYLIFDKTEIRVRQGETKITEPVLDGVHVPVRYSSSDNKIASVDPETGTITLNNVIGKAVITARSEGTLSYAPGEASYTIYVDPVPVQAEKGNGTYLLVFTDSKYKKMALSATPSTVANHLSAVEQIGSTWDNGYFLVKDPSLLWDLNHMASDITTLENEGNFISYEGGHIGLQPSFYSAAQFVLSSPEHGFYNLSFVQGDERVLLTYHNGSGFALVPGESSNINFEVLPAKLDTKPTLSAPVFTATPTSGNTAIQISWNSVSSAQEYLIYVDDILVDTFTASGSVTRTGLEFGNHKVKVVARAAGYYDGVAEKEVYLSNPAGLSPVSYTHSFVKEDFTAGHQTKNLGGYNWTIDTDGGYFGYDGTKGLQVGSKNAAATKLSLTSSDFGGPVSTVRVNTSGASSIKADLKVKVGGQYCGTEAVLTSSPTTYTFSCGEKTGDLVLEWTNTSAKAIYIKSIEVDYKK